MTPRWLAIEKLVTELGAVCRLQHEARGAALGEAVDEDVAERAVIEATMSVTDAIGHVEEDGDAVVREAWQAIAVAQDAIANLRRTVDRSRELRERAQRLQDESLRWRLVRPRLPAPASSPFRRKPSGD